MTRQPSAPSPHFDIKMNFVDNLTTFTRPSSLLRLTPRSIRRLDLTQQTMAESVLQGRQRVCINIRGTKFETYQETLERFPDTLLGSQDKREPFYDTTKKEYYFDRDKVAFNYILFFYQSNGIISKPDDIPRELFNKELTFYELVEDETSATPDHFVVLSEHSFKDKIWDVLERPSSGSFAKCLANLSVLMIVLSTIIFCLETIPEARLIANSKVGYRNQNSIAKDAVFCQSVWRQDHKNDKLNLTLNGNTVNCTKLNKTDNDGGSSRADTQGSLTQGSDVWFIVESVFISFFTCEYLARVYSSPQRVQFIKSTLGIVDFIAIIPFYLTLILQHDYSNVTSFSVIRVTRIVRVMRVLKLSRYHKGLSILGRTITASSGQMKSLFLCVFLAVVLLASAIYYLESFQTNSPFKSIPATFWYVIITMTTVGYGDVTPKTVLGKLAGAACAFVGVVLLLCLPTPVFVSNFVQFYTEECCNDDKDGQSDSTEKLAKPRWADTEFKNMKYVTVKNSKVPRRN